MKIEFNDILQRWMFSSEVCARTFEREMCLSKNCMRDDPRRCGIVVKRKLMSSILLVIFGDVKTAAKVKMGKRNAAISFMCCIAWMSRRTSTGDRLLLRPVRIAKVEGQGKIPFAARGPLVRT